MLQHEFEGLTGLKVNENQYEVINGMYMRNDNQTKQEFCKSFMEMGLMAHVDYVVTVKKELNHLKMQRYELESQRDMWRSDYIEAKEKASALENRLNAIADMVKGGAE